MFASSEAQPSGPWPARTLPHLWPVGTMSTYVNPRPQPVRLMLSDGSERTVRAWGLAFVPDAVQVVRAEFDPSVERELKPREPERKAA